MAPKKSKRQTRMKGASKAKAAPRNMAEVDLLNSSHASRKRRSLGRRDSEEKLDRQVQLHFQHMTTQQLNTIRVNGQLVRDRVRSDKSARMSAGASRLGSCYWRNLVTEYSTGLGTFGALKPSTPNLPVRRSLSVGLRNLPLHLRRLEKPHAALTTEISTLGLRLVFVLCCEFSGHCVQSSERSALAIARRCSGVFRIGFPQCSFWVCRFFGFGVGHLQLLKQHGFTVRSLKLRCDAIGVGSWVLTKILYCRTLRRTA